MGTTEDAIKAAVKTAVTSPDTPPPFLESQESSTKCQKCGQVAVLSDNGFCGSCIWQKDLDEEKRKTRLANMTAVFGEGALEQFRMDKFQSFDSATQKALEAAQVFHHSTSNIYYFGCPGSGKTHLAFAIAIKSFEDGKSVQFFPSGPSLGRHLRGLQGDEEEKRIDALSRVDVLVINELGIGHDTEFSIAVSVEVIDRRIMRGKNGLVITSNLHPADLAAKMKDARLESRFTGLCKIIEAGKEDYRKKHRKG